MSSNKPRGRIGRIFWLLAAVAMIVAVMPLAGAAADEGPVVVNLIVDGGTDSTTWVDIGYVEATDDEVTLTVKYVVEDPLWCLTATQVDIQTDADKGGFHITKKGTPKIGKFDSKQVHDPCAPTATHTFTLADFNGEEITHIAAHADTFKDGGLDAVEANLPVTATMGWINPSSDKDAYFGITITNDGAFNGVYDGWCVDIGHTVKAGTVDVFSSYEDLDLNADGSFRNIENPEFLPHVNWIINQGFVGLPSGVMKPDGITPTVYTYGDVQRAIWMLVDNDPLITAGVGTYNTARVNEIYDAALANGADFVPGCGEYFAVILASQNLGAQSTITQTTFAEVGVECEDREETAWAGVWNYDDDEAGDHLPGSFTDQFVRDSASWAGYFPYMVVEG